MKILLLCLCLCVWPLVALAERVEVYVTNQQEVIGLPATYHGDPVQLYRVDEIFRLEDRLSTELPNNEILARRLIEERLRGREVEMAKKIITAWQHTIRAHNAGIEYVPAIVIDRQWVVYGELDFATAISLYEQRP